LIALISEVPGDRAALGDDHEVALREPKSSGVGAEGSAAPFAERLEVDVELPCNIPEGHRLTVHGGTA
jgi:hypothetical protein